MSTVPPAHPETTPTTGNSSAEGISTVSFQELLEKLDIPPNIDPRLLALWIERERNELDKKDKRGEVKKRAKTHSLGGPFAAFVGITAMCLAVLLGIVQGKEAAEILPNACWTFLIYIGIGFFAGLVAEYCVADSVETLLREIIRRGHEAAESIPTAASTEANGPESGQ